jgi:3-deoxy-D-manno-octulosonic acid kinase
MRTPDGYVSGTAAGARYRVRTELEPFLRRAIESAGSLDGFARANATAALAGRGPAHVVESATGPLLVRHYRRGGAVASMLGDRYVRLGRLRPFNELRVSGIARSRGVRTPPVAAAVVYPAGVFYRGDLATEYLADTTTLADLTFGPGRRNEPERLDAWRATGRLARAAADAGLVHADLNLRNILVAGNADSPEPYLLDLDRCRVAGRASAGDRARMRARLHRSARKIAGPAGPATDAEFEWFDEGFRMTGEGSGD